MHKLELVESQKKIVERLEGIINTKECFSILLSGEWGTGKTECIKKIMDSKWRKNERKNKRKRYIKVSLYNLDLSNLKNELAIKIIRKNFLTGFKLFSLILFLTMFSFIYFCEMFRNDVSLYAYMEYPLIIVTLILIVSISFIIIFIILSNSPLLLKILFYRLLGGNSIEPINLIRNTKKYICIFDDLERVKDGELGDILSYINKMHECYNFNVISICNDSEIKSLEGFEKVFTDKIRLILEFDELKSIIFSDIDESAEIVLKEILENNDINNIRYLKSVQGKMPYIKIPETNNNSNVEYYYMLLFHLLYLSHLGKIKDFRNYDDYLNKMTSLINDVKKIEIDPNGYMLNSFFPYPYILNSMERFNETFKMASGCSVDIDSLTIEIHSFIGYVENKNEIENFLSKLQFYGSSVTTKHNLNNKRDMLDLLYDDKCQFSHHKYIFEFLHDIVVINYFLKEKISKKELSRLEELSIKYSKNKFDDIKNYELLGDLHNGRYTERLTDELNKVYKNIAKNIYKKIILNVNMFNNVKISEFKKILGYIRNKEDYPGVLYIDFLIEYKSFWKSFQRLRKLDWGLYLHILVSISRATLTTEVSHNYHKFISSEKQSLLKVLLKKEMTKKVYPLKDYPTENIALTNVYNEFKHNYEETK